MFEMQAMQVGKLFIYVYLGVIYIILCHLLPLFVFNCANVVNKN